MCDKSCCLPKTGESCRETRRVHPGTNSEVPRRFRGASMRLWGILDGKWLTERRSPSKRAALPKRFGDVEAVAGIDFDVRSGELFGFLGPNGAGKTTTINMFTGLARPDSGTIALGGVDCTKNPPRRTAPHRGGPRREQPLSGADRLREPDVLRVAVRNAEGGAHRQGVGAAGPVRTDEGRGAQVRRLLEGDEAQTDHRGGGSSTSRVFSFWTSRPRASTSPAPGRCGSLSPLCTRRGRPSFSPRTTSRRPNGSATGSHFW